MTVYFDANGFLITLQLLIKIKAIRKKARWTDFPMPECQEPVLLKNPCCNIEKDDKSMLKII